MSEHDTTNPSGADWLGSVTPADTIAVREDQDNDLAVIQIGQRVGGRIAHVVTLAVPLTAAQAWGGSLLNLNREVF